ncbi:MAG: C40 family peptidase, partial [Bacteroidia bacterium]
SSIFTQCKVVSKNNLEEGDLVFFKIDGDNISHIGVYLQNNKFVHATTKKGVMVDDLDEDYYKKYYYKGGRIK